MPRLVWLPTRQTQTLLTGGILEPSTTHKKGKGKEVASKSQDDDYAEERGSEGTGEGSSTKKKPMYSKDKVRVSQANRTLDSMFPIAGPSTQLTSNQTQSATEVNPIDIDADNNHGTENVGGGDDQRDKYRRGVNVNPEDQEKVDRSRVKYIKESQCFLKTVKELREEVQGVRHEREHRLLSMICGMLK